MNNKNKLNEATGAGSVGKFKVPIVLAPELWTKDQLAPFVDSVYSYSNAELAYEEADNDFKETPEKRAEIENRTKKLSKLDQYLKQFYTGQNDDEGSNIASVESPEKLIQQAVGPLKEEFMKEDLAVWFGTKKKPKGSKQPKGPWVNICRKKEGGGHPPCGRPEASGKGYPKCRAAGVASKMSDSQKKAACSQKRRAEKSKPKTGTGNKPTMTSYKPRKESVRNLIKRILREEYNPQMLYPVEQVYMMTSRAPFELKKIVKGLKPIACVNSSGEKRSCFRIPEVLYVYLTGRY
jgi:hypothetical protein